jgi:glutamine---fructose-6-phosphate transaminase (isomerizing)
MSYLDDILNQPGDLKRALAGYQSEAALRQMTKIAELGYRKILFSGMGSSNYCCQGAVILLNRHGFSASVLSAGELLHYEMGLPSPDTLLVLVSQSGESAEIVKLTEGLPKSQMIAAVTNDPGSTLGRRGNYTFILDVPEEESVTTRTYLASMLLTGLLASMLAGLSPDAYCDRAIAAIDSLEGFLAGHADFSGRMRHFFANPGFICLIGRGDSLSTVQAGALFLQEVVKYPAIAFDSGEFRHGPFEMVQEGFAAIVVAPKGETCDLNIHLAQDIAIKGGRVLLITNEKLLETADNLMVANFDGNVDEMLSPIVTVAPIQLLADGMAKGKGVEAGKFRWGTKVMKVE